MCGWLRLCKVFLTDVERCGERAVDEVRVPDPIQTNEL